VLTWWAFRVPLAYLLIAGFAKFATESIEVQRGISGPGLFFGALFLLALVMSVVSALRLLPVRVCIEPPKDWHEAEANIVRNGE
jgi:hypothetical protein